MQAGNTADLSAGSEHVAAATQDEDGATTYWVRLFYDASSEPSEEERERAAAAALWERREARRRRYAQRRGLPAFWPVAHPTTVIDLTQGPHGVRAAVCIRCDWVQRATDEGGQPVDLDQSAKQHSLDHLHERTLKRRTVVAMGRLRDRTRTQQ